MFACRKSQTTPSSSPPALPHELRTAFTENSQSHLEFHTSSRSTLDSFHVNDLDPLLTISLQTSLCDNQHKHTSKHPTGVPSTKR
ncbi:hypothetical protein PFLUV_G00174490 [Perca fluviatilis]|uniref:Uncharacterized protein n=1 Tax=Perca fluviatilis TaxID=8168 RepID=A0A6A5EK36_PERFL|nr:hypothetical protein PFLUV_G00174490 [Perca fluviatilis]